MEMGRNPSPPATGSKKRGFLGFPSGSHRHVANRRTTEGCELAVPNGTIINARITPNLPNTAASS
jgi:hypothetical protein